MGQAGLGTSVASNSIQASGATRHCLSDSVSSATRRRTALAATNTSASLKLRPAETNQGTPSHHGQAFLLSWVDVHKSRRSAANVSHHLARSRKISRGRKRWRLLASCLQWAAWRRHSFGSESIERKPRRERAKRARPLRTLVYADASLSSAAKRALSVSFWHLADSANGSPHVRSRGQS